MARLGIFGGTFDPPHWAHLILAEAARGQLALDRVWWVLTPDPPHKDRPDISPYAARKRMVLAAISGNDGFELCEVEQERPGPHYMADTMDILQARRPGDAFVLLIGEDSLRDLPLWHQPERLLRKFPLAVLRRPGSEADLAELDKALPEVAARVTFLDAPRQEISSTAIRACVRAGRSIRYWLPLEVETVIRAESLYR